MAGKYYYAYDQPEGEPWFVDGEGIERRVIQTDLPRYLGNGTTLRAGMGPDNCPGYWYNAYRPLTDQMIASLKADSARWLSEKRESNRKREPEPGTYRSPTLSAFFIRFFGGGGRTDKGFGRSMQTGWPEYFQSQAWKDSRRRAAPTITAELPAPQEPHPSRIEVAPPMDPRFPSQDSYGRQIMPPHGGHGGRPGYGGNVPRDQPPINPGPPNYRLEFEPRYPGGQNQQYPPHGHDTGPMEPPSDAYRPRQYPPDYSGQPNPANPQQGSVEPPQRQPQQLQPEQYYYPTDYYRQQQPYYPPRASD